MISAMEPVQSAPKMADTHAAKPMKVKINRQADAQGQGQSRRSSTQKERKDKDRRDSDFASQMHPQQQAGNVAAMQRDMLAQQNAMLMQQMAHLNQAFWCSQMQTAALVAKDMVQTNPYGMYMPPTAPPPEYIEQDTKRHGSTKSKKNRKPSLTISPQTSMNMNAQSSLPFPPPPMLSPPSMMSPGPLRFPMTPSMSMGHPSPMHMNNQWSDVSTAIPFSPQSSLQSSFEGSRRSSVQKTDSRRGSHFSHQENQSKKSDSSKQPKAVIEERPQPQTTVMIRNLVETCTRQMLLDFLNHQGFEKQFDMVYLPLKFCSKLCFHYAFVNFTTEEVTKRFIKDLQGYKGAEAFGEQACDISMSVDNQGLAAAIKRYRNSPVMHPSVPDECKPLIFKDGKPIPFPPPTKNIRKPRKDMGDVSKEGELAEVAEEEQPKEIERRSSFESHGSEE
jgi:hypothetical protein|mmetsp:Transcript_116363/g.181858  ORF Transcript_116363/g.181858 Transcript_116363/m.181858 type:complete len:447 (+) Transcript_116363:75-1415(+)